MTTSRPLPLSSAERDRLRRMVRDHFEEIVAAIRRAGVVASDAEDAAQRVFIVASRRICDVTKGSERSFLFGVALRVASDMRRRAYLAHEVQGCDVDAPQEGRNVDSIVDRCRARLLVDEVLNDMDAPLREVFVLAELEEMPLREIARTLAIAQGTVASRLRRAREQFTTKVERLRAAKPRDQAAEGVELGLHEPRLPVAVTLATAEERSSPGGRRRPQDAPYPRSSD